MAIGIKRGGGLSIASSLTNKIVFSEVEIIAASFDSRRYYFVFSKGSDCPSPFVGKSIKKITISYEFRGEHGYWSSAPTLLDYLVASSTTFTIKAPSTTALSGVVTKTFTNGQYTIPATSETMFRLYDPMTVNEDGYHANGTIYHYVIVEFY